ncbi:nuclease [Neomoorella glycerini]|uniref:Nuclease n=1 Tax=Neomoorella glycerini TaxID=55779 RepID=A0A6I5ZQK3_9FIRM|nr:thermonuclease family protein [Moorella glycerini]QGP92264.1 nuclease [Moorella glycerini]
MVHRAAPFLATILAGCSGSPGASSALQQSTASSAKIADTQNATNNQQGSEQQPKTDNPAAGPLKVLPAVVTNVADGDTLQVKIGGREEKVRLIGVNTPEIAHPDLRIKEQPYGKEAAAYTQKRLAGRQVYLELDTDLFTKLQREAREAGKGLWSAAVTAPAPALRGGVKAKQEL